MAQKKSNLKERQIGKQKAGKKPLINPRYKNTFWTVVIFAVLLVFFIVNNTRSVPESGPLPPGYNPANLNERLNDEVPDEIKVDSVDSKK